MNLELTIQKIVADDSIHAKWLNTLSMMENSGAKKISASEHPTQVNIIILKHAAEEARHAYYLKKQLSKLKHTGCEDYTYKNILAPVQSYQYLHRLDTHLSRYIQEKLQLTGYELRYAAYLLVTYAIEVRADSLYEIYQSALKSVNSKVTVKSIIMEEIGHLEEMTKQLIAFSENWKEYADFAITLEKQLFTKWITQVEAELN